MKSRILTCITAMTLFAALASPIRLGAQHHRYKLVDIGTFGGPAGYGTVYNVADAKELSKEPAN